ncbi:MAG: AmmeMemoRadiSam system radical SAM enzyme [Candidatus Riflebacteria bacterium]|nr:AmmeMemoRadiSam system radical SAM enzyme [Candidatus Riflebacteria bacterium]
MKKALYTQDFSDYSECFLCPNKCKILEGKTGRCLSRKRILKTVQASNYGIIVSASVDPIEKKPLYHFFPGHSIFSIGTFGCNLHCTFCQNFEISQNVAPGQLYVPSEIADLSVKTLDNVGVAFTYNEPGTWFEFIMDTAPLIIEQGQKVVLVTNGYLSDAPWLELCKISDAMNIDIKSFDPNFYSHTCGGKLDQVIKNIETAFANNVHIELTNLIVTGKNEDLELFEKLIKWVASISPNIPFHISRYFPRFKETAPPTKPETLLTLYNKAREFLNFVYVGNLATEEENNTICPSCKKLWIERVGYSVRIVHSGEKCTCGLEKKIRFEL